LPINAVQFTILSIIAAGYRPVVAPYGSELSSILLPISKTATIDKTLFYVITTLPQLQISYLVIVKSSIFVPPTNLMLSVPVLPLCVFPEIFFQEIQR
jgi:hypothetical protein